MMGALDRYDDVLNPPTEQTVWCADCGEVDWADNLNYERGQYWCAECIKHLLPDEEDL